MPRLPFLSPEEHAAFVWFDMIRGELAPHNMAPHV